MNIFVALLPGLLVIALLGGLALKLRRDRAREQPGPNGERPYGVFGWLAFYVLMSYVIAPLFAVGRTNAALLDVETMQPMVTSLAPWLAYKRGTWAIVFAFVCWQWYVAYGLRNRLVPVSVRNTKIMLLSAPGLMVGADALLSQITLGSVGDGGIVARELAKAYVPALAWFLYFTFSKRVRNTYARGTPTAAPLPVATNSAR